MSVTTFETVILGFGNNTGVEVPVARRVTEAKADATRDRRIAKIVDTLT